MTQNSHTRRCALVDGDGSSPAFRHPSIATGSDCRGGDNREHSPTSDRPERVHLTQQERRDNTSPGQDTLSDSSEVTLNSFVLRN